MSSDSPVGLADLAQSLGSNVRSDLVFGEAVRHGDTTVIPVAKARWGVGSGLSTGRGGVGGGTTVKPTGYIMINSEGARYRPINIARFGMLFAVGGLIAGALAGVLANTRHWRG